MKTKWEVRMEVNLVRKTYTQTSNSPWGRGNSENSLLEGMAQT